MKYFDSKHYNNNDTWKKNYNNKYIDIDKLKRRAIIFH